MARIVHAIDYASPVPGSFIPAVAALSRALASRGDESIVVAPRFAQPPPWRASLEAAGATVLHTRRYSELLPLLARLRPDVVHAHFSGYSVPSAVGARLLALPRVYWHVHSRPAIASPSPRRRLMRRWKFGVLGRGVTRVLAVSAQIAGDALDLGSVPQNIRVLANAIDVRKFKIPTDAERAAARAAMSFNPSDRVLLFFGRDAAIKGADVLREAFARSERAPRLMLIGPRDVAGVFEPFASVSRLERLDDVRSAIWASDALAMPSTTEGLPLSLLEARACGLPAFVSDIASLREFALSDTGTTVIARTDLDAWAHAIDSIEPGASVPLPLPLLRQISLDRWVAEVLDMYDV